MPEYWSCTHQPLCMESNATAGGRGELDKSFPADSDLCHSALVMAMVHFLNYAIFKCLERVVQWVIFWNETPALLSTSFIFIWAVVITLWPQCLLRALQGRWNFRHPLCVWDTHAAVLHWGLSCCVANYCCGYDMLACKTVTEWNTDLANHSRTQFATTN